MKKIQSIISGTAFLAAGIFAFSSCAKTDLDEQPSSGLSIETNLTITGASTRTGLEWDQDNNNYNTFWTEGDAIGVYVGSSNNAQLTSSFSDRAETTTFSGTVALSAGQQTLYAYFPYSSIETDGADGPSRIRVLLSEQQNPASITSFDPNADIMVAKPLSFNASGSGSETVDGLQFQRLMAIAKIVAPNIASQLSNEPILSIKMTVGSSTEDAILTGRLRVDAVNGQINETDGFYNSQSNSVSAAYDASLNFQANGTNAAYVIVNPVTINSGTPISFEIKTENFTATKTSNAPNDIILSANGETTLTLNPEEWNVTSNAGYTPITQFSYNDIEENISGVSFSNPVVEMDGEEVTYAFVNLPDELAELNIDPQTGTVSCEKGIELPVGKHTVTVEATNPKNSMQASFSINVVANPNFFTYVRWGNNLGPNGEALTPLEKYGNQYRVYQGSETLRINVIESDIPAGATVSYLSDRKTDNSSGFSINATTGRADIYPKEVGGTVYPHVHFVHVTVGEGEAAITRTFPFFIDQCGPVSGYQIEYTPFVFRVNPKTGGTSVAPTITTADGQPFSGGSIDYYTNICFYNLYGPEEHTNDKRLNQDNSGFLKTVWNKYYNSINQPPNYGVRYPMTYWDNYDKNQLSFTGGYFEPESLRFVVNPEKFVDEYGYANGIMTMITKFNTDGVNPNTTTTNTYQTTRLIIWFDPDYTGE